MLIILFHYLYYILNEVPINPWFQSISSTKYIKNVSNFWYLYLNGHFSVKVSLVYLSGSKEKRRSHHIHTFTWQIESLFSSLVTYVSIYVHMSYFFGKPSGPVITITGPLIYILYELILYSQYELHMYCKYGDTFHACFALDTLDSIQEK